MKLMLKHKKCQQILQHYTSLLCLCFHIQRTWHSQLIVTDRKGEMIWFNQALKIDSTQIEIEDKHNVNSITSDLLSLCI